MMAAVLQANNTPERQSGKVSGRRRCSCCPYGYHIDLDFVRYCESITNSQLMPDPSRRRINNIKRKRASREALLGLVDFPNLRRENSSPRVSQDVGDDLQKAVIDFEKTLLNTSLPRGTRLYHSKDWQTYENRHYNGGSLDRYQNRRNNVTVPLTSHESHLRNGAEPKPKNDFENANNSEANNASAETLQAIRTQMAMSLKRMRELEEEIKLIPGFKEEIEKLQSENLKLRTENLKIQNSFKLNGEIHGGRKKQDAGSNTVDTCHTRTVGVGCTVLTRDIGIAMIPISVKSVGTETEKPRESENNDNSISLDKIIGTTSKFKYRSAETSTDLKLDRFMSDNEILERLNLKRSITKLKMKDAETLTEILLSDVFTKSEVEKQQSMKRKILKNVQTSTLVNTNNAQTMTKPDLKNAIVSTKLNQHQIFTQEDVEEEISKHIQLYEKNVLNNALTKKSMMISVGIQVSEVMKVPDCITVGTQVVLKTQEIGIVAKPRVYDHSSQAQCQTHDIGVSEDTITKKDCEKCNVLKFSTSTNFPELGSLGIDLLDKNIDFNMIVKKKSQSATTDTEDLIFGRDVGVNTMKTKSVNTGSETCEFPCKKCVQTQEMPLKPLTPVPPKRPSYLPIPIQRHGSKPPSPSISRTISNSAKAVSTQPKRDEIECDSKLRNPTLDRLRNEESNSDSGSDDGTYTVLQDSSASSKLESFLTQSPKPKNYIKKEPTKEMRGAMKVLNDALQQSPSEDFPKHMKTAINIIQQEWFKVSSVATSNPHHVEDYLDCFEEISSTLLEYVVNLTDVTGNTAMHYAVSNGNFDVVSILLDSKVCNINKLNTAGYTCIMLVALTKVKSETDREVVRRLFHMADVNIRAKEHGQTALMLAVSHGRIDTVEMLLEAGADINIQDEDGSTALMCAAEHGCIEIVKLLLAQPDCDLSITDYDGSTALTIAMNAGNRDVGVLLYAQEHFSRGSSPYTSLKGKRAKSTTPTLKMSRPATPSHSSYKKDFDAIDP